MMVVMVMMMRVDEFVVTDGQRLLLAQPEETRPDGRVAPVGEKGEDEEDGRAHIRPSHDPGHGLRVHRMRSKEATGHGRRQSSPGRQKGAGQEGEEGRGRAMEQNVDQMISGGFQLVDPVIEPEREDAERPVGLVRAGMGQGSAPKIVEHQVDPWR